MSSRRPRCSTSIDANRASEIVLAASGASAFEVAAQNQIDRHADDFLSLARHIEKLGNADWRLITKGHEQIDIAFRLRATTGHGPENRQPLNATTHAERQQAFSQFGNRWRSGVH